MRDRKSFEKWILYTYECPEHGDFDELAHPDDRFIYCKVNGCSKLSKRVINFRGTIQVFKEYYHPTLDKLITSADQLREEHKKINARPLMPGDKVDPRKRIREIKEQGVKATEESVKKFVYGEVAQTLDGSKPIPGVKRFLEKQNSLKERGII